MESYFVDHDPASEMLRTTPRGRYMDALRDGLPTGSLISLTHATADFAPEDMRAVSDLYAEAGLSENPRSLELISALLEPWHVASPGIVPTARWHLPARHQGAHGIDHSHACAAGITARKLPAVIGR